MNPVNGPQFSTRDRDELVGQLAARGWIRLVQEVLAESTREHWLRRADEFAAVGTPTADATALACRRHATLCLTEQDAIDAIRDYLTDTGGFAA